MNPGSIINYIWIRKESGWGKGGWGGREAWGKDDEGKGGWGKEEAWGGREAWGKDDEGKGGWGKEEAWGKNGRHEVRRMREILYLFQQLSEQDH